MYNREIDDSWNFKTANTKEYTHCYHAYPAMMIPQVARRLITDFKPTGGCSIIFDPYMGSGTTLVEASLRGIDSVGTDINPLARMMTVAKTTHFDVEQIERYLSQIALLSFNYDEKEVKDRDFSHISNYTFWYSEDVLLKLSYLSQQIENYDEKVRLFFNVALSEVVREVSFTRNGEFKRFRMKEEKIKDFHPDVFSLFESKLNRNIIGLKSYNETAPNCTTRVCDFNTVGGIPDEELADESVDMIVTSPPYGDSRTTVAYGQFSRWANEWFRFSNSQNLDNILMGGGKQHEERFQTQSIEEELNQIKSQDEKRYYEVVSFLNDYKRSIDNISPKIRKGGRICYVVGNRNVKGVQIPLDFFTAEMFERNGFSFETIIVREIPSKRMPSKTSPTNVTGAKVSTMSNEYMVVMTKK